MARENGYVLWFEDVNSDDVAKVGGKNASLGEMIGSLKGKDVRVPEGFATTADAYREFLEANDLSPKIKEALENWQKEKTTLEKAGKSIRKLFRQWEPVRVGGVISHKWDERRKER